MTTRMLPNAVHFKEFQNDPVTGVHYTATCGETALATALVCASPQIESTQEAIDLMTSMTREMMSLGWADKPLGATTTARLRDEAHRRGFTTEDANFISYQLPLDMNKLHTLLLAEAGIRPIVLEVSKAGNLNSYNGGSDEAGVQFHFITVVGIDDTGYWCNDGDNSAITDHLVIYPWSEIEQAAPCGVLVVNMQETSMSIVPTGWKDDGKTLTAPNGVVVVGGMRDFVLAFPGGWAAANQPAQAEEHLDSVDAAKASTGPGVSQLFRYAHLILPDDPQNHKVQQTWIGVEVKALESQVAALKAQVATLSGTDADLTKQLVAANALIAELQSELQNPAPAKLTPQQQDVMNAFASLVKAMQEGQAA